MTEKLRMTSELIREADAVLVGIGSGMSSAAGYNHYSHNAVFRRNFGDFEEKYGIQGMFPGFYYIFSTPEQQWGYYARYIQFMEDAPAGKPYLDLLQILKDKDYFILTTNIDIQIPKVFPEERYFQFQGDFRFLQCSQPCHDKLYRSRRPVEAMIAGMNDLEVPSELIPRCPECGWKMVPWVQDDTFLRGAAWQAANRRYEEFLRKYRDKRLVLLELGVGDMTPSIIRLPFWDMTAKFPDAFLITVNLAKGSAPEQLKGRSLAIGADLAEVMGKLKSF